MKKLILIILTIHCSLFTPHSNAQPCLPQGITFNNQAQIDNFPMNYPECNVIGGDVKILGDDITNLDSLIVLTSIEGDLDIGECWSFPNGNPLLSNLTGLANLTHIGGSLLICQNHILNSLDGLDNITHVEGQLYIGDHANLINITSLGNLLEVGENIIVQGNQMLQSLTGLEGIENVDGTLNVWFNNSLVNLNGLDNISSIGSLGLEGNEILKNLEGLESLDYVEGDVTIGCIYGWMHHNPSIKSLSGLNNLSMIGGSLWINLNDSLLNLTGLENLTNIGESIIIEGNPVLTDLTGIENLFTIGNGINISYNNSLISLTGLDNIDKNTIEGLYIHNNMSLTKCDIQSICEYLTIPNANVDIQDNASGCNSEQEVEEACAQSVDEISTISNLSIHPNPFSNTTTIEFELKQPEIITITIYNHIGEQIEMIAKNKSVGQQMIELNCEGLPAGIYFCVIKTNKGMQTIKMIKL